MAQLFRNLVQDVRFTLRQAKTHSGFSLTAVFVLALGIGGSTAVFSIFYQVLLQPLPYPAADRLVLVHNLFPKSQVSTAGVSGFDYAEVKRHTDTFAAAGIYYWNDLTLTGFGNARHIDVVNASSSLFDTLGVKPQLGRKFNSLEERRGAPGTVLLSDQLWRGTFGSDPHVAGRIIHLNGSPYTVAGVMPPSFHFPSRETQLWVPIGLNPGEFTIQGGRTEKWLHMLARLAPGVSLDKAQAMLQVIDAELGTSFPGFYPQKDGWKFTIRQLADEQTETVRRWLYLAFGAVFSVLLIACINVSGLLLIQGTSRVREIGVRRASGATRSRIVCQLLTETGLLALSSCGLGFLLSVWAVHLVNLYGPLGQPVAVRNETVFFALAMVLVSTIIAGLLPALVTAEVPIAETLKSGSTRTSRKDSGLRYLIVATQIAFAVGLIFTAAQLNRSFLNLTRVPAGFEQRHVWTGAITLPSHTYIADQSWNTRFFEPLLERLRTIPGVQAASGANAIPFNPNGIWTEAFHLPERPAISPKPEAQIGLAFPGYFEAIGIPVLKGRTFTKRDRDGAPRVAVIDEELARRYFPGQQPIGQLIASGGATTPARIVGVVGSVHNSDLGGPRQPEVYYPELQERTEATYLVLRTDNSGDPTAAVRQSIAQLDRDVAVFDVQFMDGRVAASLKLRRFIAYLLNGLALIGLILAIVGLYGSLAHLVALRRHEIGIRVALGAMQSQIIRIIVLRASIIVGLGLSAGIVCAFAAQHAVRAQLFGVQPTDAATWIGVIGSIMIASTLSALLPARLAARIDPSAALRSE